MKARRVPRIDIQDRDELRAALPLRTPFIIHIDPCDTCNFRCRFCPTGDRELMKKTKGRFHGPMDFDLYRERIDSLADFDDPIRVIRLYKEGEPLLNPRFADMVEKAAAELAPHRVCQYLYELADNFNGFYHANKIVSEPDEEKRNEWITMLQIVLKIFRGKHRPVLRAPGKLRAQREDQRR